MALVVDEAQSKSIEASIAVLIIGDFWSTKSSNIVDGQFNISIGNALENPIRFKWWHQEGVDFGPCTGYRKQT